ARLLRLRRAYPMKKMVVGLLVVALWLIRGGSAGAGIADSALPVLVSGETTFHLYSVPGVMNDNQCCDNGPDRESRCNGDVRHRCDALHHGVPRQSGTIPGIGANPVHVEISDLHGLRC